MLSTIRPFFSGLILAPDDSRISCTFLSIPFASSRCSGITLSRPFTAGRSAVRGRARVRPTVEAARDGLVAVALPDHELDVRVLARDALDVPCDEAARVGRGRAVLAKLEDDLADGGDECGVSVGGCRAQLGPQECGRHGGR